MELKLKYRPDVDALRGIAIVSVLLFHYRFTQLPGGFVGVDIFFVISGYLITNIIAINVEQENFSFRNFFLRRARRLLPSYLVTIACCFTIAVSYLSPIHLERFGRAIIYSLLYASNFFYIGEVGYFDADALFKPLLHTWSLGVEAQIYLLWSVFLTLTWRRKRLLTIGILGLFSLSLVGSVLVSGGQTSYYFPLFRLYEFIIGAVTYILAKHKLGGVIWSTVLYCFGAVMICFSICFFDDTTPFPSFYALIPCVGTALMVLSHSNCTLVIKKIISNKVFSGIGLISYPLYLVHWPILVFYHYIVFRQITITEKVFCIIFSFTTACLFYVLVEKPIRRSVNISNEGLNFRTSRSKAIILIALGALMLILPALSVSVSAYGGWSWRFSEESGPMQDQLKSVVSKKDTYFKTHNVLTENKDAEEKNRHILIVGDSHSKDLFNALSMNNNLMPDTLLYQFELDEKCHEPNNMHISQSFLSKLVFGQTTFKMKEECMGKKEALLALNYAKNADIIIIANHWESSNIEFLTPTIKFINSLSDAKVVMLGVHYLPFDPPTLAFTKGLRKETEKMMFQLDQFNKIAELNNTFREIARENNLEYIDILSLVCPAPAKRCKLFGPMNKILYHDTNHWTPDGELYFGKLIIDNYNEIFNEPKNSQYVEHRGLKDQ